MASHFANYLSSVAPFSYLSGDILSEISTSLQQSHLKQDTILFTQSVTKVENLCIVQKGALEIYYDDGDKKSLQGFLGEGEIFGGISMLLNNDLSIRTVRVHEDSTLLLLPKKTFLGLCKNNSEFSAFFTDSFGKRMLDKSYAAIISKSSAAQIDSGLSVFNEKISTIANSRLVSCSAETTIREAASIMSQQKISAILIADADGFIGIITDKDFREKVVVKGISADISVTEIMSSPLITIDSETPVFEALLFMMDKKIKHLLISSASGQITGLISDNDLVLAQGHSPMYLLQKIISAEQESDLFSFHSQLPQVIKSMIRNGARAEIVNRLVTHISDEILKKLVEFALKKSGPAPLPFVFMIMGSEGRREQTLKTDQDNAIIYQDPPAGESEKVQKYFLNLGKTICSWLDKAGYTYCKGDVMAQNPKWCQPLKTWKGYFTKWIATPEPLALMHSSIFFDFRSGYGETTLIEKLREHLFKELSGRNTTLFYYHLSKNAMQFKPPLGFFRNFVVESQGKHKNAFDIKKAMTPIVDFTRLYALSARVTATNTLARLEALYQQKVIEKNEFEDLKQAYTYLMQLRFSRQLQAIMDEHVEADNYIIPKNLNHIEQKVLKEIFTLIEKFQQKLSMKFTGMA
ncbi:MAG: cyclic nucleotide-binding/CBS domain-containing protein [Calditrichae bacterium]|nr:cyclic nucleotide-binding/CBS domain-containing protein [Calditrichia bacterium]